MAQITCGPENTSELSCDFMMPDLFELYCLQSVEIWYLRRFMSST